MGSELINYGLSLPLDIWSAKSNISNPELVYKIHQENINSGASYITTNTFRTTPRAYKKTGLSKEDSQLKSKKSLNAAVKIAKDAAKNRAKVLGSIAPLEDCYKPELFPGKDVAIKEFKDIGKELARGDVDIIIMETMNSIIEIESCLLALQNIKKPIWVGLNLLNSNSLQSRESIKSAIEKIKMFDVDCLLLNCNSIDRTASALKYLSTEWNKKWGIYPNLGIGEPSPTGEINKLSSDKEFLETAKSAVSLGSSILGGCCGSNSRHIKLLQKEFL